MVRVREKYEQLMNVFNELMNVFKLFSFLYTQRIVTYYRCPQKRNKKIGSFSFVKIIRSITVLDCRAVYDW